MIKDKKNTFSLKFIKTFLILPLIIGCSDNININNDLKDLELIGEVKYLILSEYETNQKFGKIEKGERTQAKTISFNKDGNIIQENLYDKNHFIYKKIENTYNTESKKIKTDVYTDGKLLVKWLYSYNEIEKTRQEKIYDSTGELFKENLLIFNNDGFIKESKSFKENRELSSYNKYVYDSKLNIIQKIWYSSDDIIFKTIKYNFDKDNNEIKESIYNSKNLLILENIKLYNKKGNLSEINSFGKKLFEESINLALLRTTKYSYEYDEKNNWIKRITSDKNSVPKKITERIIEYY